MRPTVIVKGKIIEDGGAAPYSAGICWSLQENPSIADDKTAETAENIEFMSHLVDLVPDTKYFARAYATNVAGTGYGEVLTFTTPEGRFGHFTDPRDGQTYGTVKICEQVWMTKNMNYASEIGSYCYDGIDGYCINYGKLYTGTSAQTACPEGWHLPRVEEWSTLIECLSENQSFKLRSVTGWPENTNGDNSTGFNALPGGYGNYIRFTEIGQLAYFWSAGRPNSSYVTTFKITGNNYLFQTGDAIYGQNKFSVRCIKDTPINLPAMSVNSHDIRIKSAILEGDLINDGGAYTTRLGFCWSTHEDPTLDDNVLEVSELTGHFSKAIDGLNPNTTYYVRSFGINSAGTGYSKNETFTTLNGGTFTDGRDGTEYLWTQIGSQTWMAQNLAYLPHVSPAGEGDIWIYSYFGNSVDQAKATNFYKTFGALYNRPAAVTDPANPDHDICPPGWHLPSLSEWDVLKATVGDFPGYKLKSSQTWSTYNGNGPGIDSYGFGVLGGGFYHNGGFYNIGDSEFFWTSDSGLWGWPEGVGYIYLNADNYYVNWSVDIGGGVVRGCSVRCIKN